MLGLEHARNGGTWLIEYPSQHRCRLVDDPKQGCEENFPRRQVGEGLDLRFVKESPVEETALYLGLFKFLLKVFNGLSGSAYIFRSGDKRCLALQSLIQPGHSRGFESALHVAVLSHMTLSPTLTQTSPELVELRHRHSGIIHDEEEGRSIYPAE